MIVVGKLVVIDVEGEGSSEEIDATVRDQNYFSDLTYFDVIEVDGSSMSFFALHGYTFYRDVENLSNVYRITDLETAEEVHTETTFAKAMSWILDR